MEVPRVVRGGGGMEQRRHCDCEQRAGLIRRGETGGGGAMGERAQDACGARIAAPWRRDARRLAERARAAADRLNFKSARLAGP